MNVLCLVECIKTCSHDLIASHSTYFAKSIALLRGVFERIELEPEFVQPSHFLLYLAIESLWNLLDMDGRSGEVIPCDLSPEYWSALNTVDVGEQISELNIPFLATVSSLLETQVRLTTTTPRKIRKIAPISNEKVCSIRLLVLTHMPVGR